MHYLNRYLLNKVAKMIFRCQIWYADYILFCMSIYELKV